MKVAIVLGTRPEAIKLAPVINKLREYYIETIVISTAQHREMLDETLKVFKIKPDYDLNIMQKGQTLSDISIKIFQKINYVYSKEKPSIVWYKETP